MKDPEKLIHEWKTTRIHVTIILSILLTIAPASAQTYTFSPKKLEHSIADVNCIFLSAGPKHYVEVPPAPCCADECRGKSYRVSFLLRETCCNIAIEELYLGGAGCSDIKVVNTFLLTGSDIIHKLRKIHKLTDLKFIRWKSWNSFIIQESDDRLLISALPDGAFKITKLERK